MTTETVSKCDACGRTVDHYSIGWHELDRFDNTLTTVFREKKIILCTRCNNNLMSSIKNPIDLAKLKTHNDMLKDMIEDMIDTVDEFSEKLEEIKKEHKL